MSNHSHAHAGADDHPLVGHLVPLWILFATATVLLVLTIITVAVRYVDLGEANIYIAIGIAGVKATLVGLYFMHLKWDRPFNQLTLVGSIAFVVLLIWFTMLDSKQYEPQLIRGNPTGVQTELGQKAPDAPIAKQNQLIR